MRGRIAQVAGSIWLTEVCPLEVKRQPRLRPSSDELRPPPRVEARFYNLPQITWYTPRKPGSKFGLVNAPGVTRTRGPRIRNLVGDFIQLRNDPSYIGKW
jgi:hypothetical protein